jgi:hypothetical protein
MAKFPLRASANRRYLVDADGKPFLYQADTPWMVFLRRTADEADEYFAARAAQGFTAVQTQLTGFLGARNRDGLLPFGERHDFSRPEERYFAGVEAILERAARRGLLVAVAPLWSGCCGEGWAGKDKDGNPKPVNAHGPEKCRALGQWLGRRFARFDNLLWILGGDQDPFNAYAEIDALARGLKEAAPRQLRTYHASSSHSSADVYPDADWLDVSMTYTYFRGFNKAWNRVQPDVYEVNALEYRKARMLPFFLGESTYEGEHDAWGSPRQVRKQAYWSLLSGATGHAYGSRYWRMEDDWRDALALPGAKSLQHLTALFAAHPFHTMIPAEDGTVFTSDRSGYGQNDHALAATDAGRSVAVCYVPTPRKITPGAGWKVARWFDPTTGAYRPARDLAPGTTLEPPGNNGGDPDWVLVLKA